MRTVVEAPVIPGMETVAVDNSEYLAVHGKLPAGGYVVYEIGDGTHSYSEYFTYDQSLAWAKHHAVEEGVAAIKLLP